MRMLRKMLLKAQQTDELGKHCGFNHVVAGVPVCADAFEKYHGFSRFAGNKQRSIVRKGKPTPPKKKRSNNNHGKKQMAVEVDCVLVWGVPPSP